MEATRDTGLQQESDESLAARFEISFDGKRFTYRQHHYDVFADALRFAASERARAGFQPDQAFRPHWLPAFHPCAAEEHVMKQHGVTYVGGHYCYGGYRYGRLSDAVAFAAHHPGR
jgi:hypothetical protein